MAKYFLFLVIRMITWFIVAVVVAFVLTWPLFFFKAPTLAAFGALAVSWIFGFAGIFTVLEWQSKYGPGAGTRSQAVIRKLLGI